MKKLALLSLLVAIPSFSQQITPNRSLTPGATLPVTAADVCVVGYSSKVRDVPVSVKRQVYREYGIAYVPRQYEVDHLTPLEIGGSNSIRNLWPEPYSGVWNAHVKDALENRLHDMVCNGDLSLVDAQREIANDWIGTYQRIFHTNQPLYTFRKNWMSRNGW